MRMLYLILTIVLMVVEQNFDTTSMDVVAARGRKVLLIWDKSHIRVVGG